MHVGDVVCFKQEFLSGYSGVNAWVEEIVDCCGEIIELRPHHIVRVRWDDNTESSIKLSALVAANKKLQEGFREGCKR